MQLFYSPSIDLTSPDFTFDKDESRHIVKVLRKKTGDQLSLTNGQGAYLLSEIISIEGKKCKVKILEIISKEKPWDYDLHIAIAPTKNIDRFEWFLEKATEIGIDQITPIICEHSERKILKTERLEKIIEAAMKQSLKFNLPKLNKACSFNTFINQNYLEHKFIAHCHYPITKLLKSELQKSKNALILIGPEGDFSKTEIQQAILKGFKEISLGKSRLRTETAGLVAVHTISQINQ